MKVCLYLEFQKLNGGASGLSAALGHQQKALQLADIPFTLDPRDGYDILHINFMGPNSYFLARKRHQSSQPTVLHIHTTPEDFRRSFTGSNQAAKILTPVFEKYLTFGQIILVPSDYTRSLLIKNYNRYKIADRVQVISNGVALDEFQPADNKRVEHFLQQYKIRKPLVFGLGLVFARKGVADFINIAKNFPNISFLWAGRRFHHFLTWDRETQAMLDDLPANVKFPGFVQDKIAALTATDIFLFPSYEENQGIVVLEAAAMGKAIIVRDIPVYHTFLEPNVNCLMARNQAEFEQHVSRLLEDEKLRQTLGRNVQQMVEKHDLRLIGQQLKKIYQNILTKK